MCTHLHVCVCVSLYVHVHVCIYVHEFVCVCFVNVRVCGLSNAGFYGLAPTVVAFTCKSENLGTSIKEG